MKLDVISDKGTPWYADGLHFTCTQCGNCCTGGPGFVWISDQEIGRLAAHLKLAERDVIRQYCRKEGQRYSLKEVRSPEGNHDCIFLRHEPAQHAADGQVAHSRRTCSIYAVRPLQCRTWPFWESNLATPDGWDRGSRRCPGMNQGRRYRRDQIERLRDAKDWPVA